MPIQIIWGNDTKSCENKIEKIIDSNISEQWKSQHEVIIFGHFSVFAHGVSTLLRF